MNNKRYKPLIDKLYLILLIPTLLLIAALTVIVCFFPATAAIIITVCVDLTVIYFLISPLFGYVELREQSVFIKYGFILNKEIPYNKIRKLERDRKFYSDSMMSLKNAFDHVNIKYNLYDVTTVSVVDNAGFIETVEKRIENK